MGFSDETGPDSDPRATAASASGALAGALGRYTIERALGRGGMGVVYLAYDPELERRVALKVLSAIDDESRLRLLREARAMARLAHANVVTVFDVGTIDGRDFVTMELMEGGTLAQWLAKPRRARDIVDAFLAAGRGLAAAHGAGLVHRDFKPANVLRSRDGRFAVTDFGLAREHDDIDSLAPPLRSDIIAVPAAAALGAVTEAGTVLGTPHYMAPEQWEGDEVTPASDQFAFCVSLFEAFAGARQLDDSAVPRRLRGVIARGLAPEPSERWPSMAALLAAIQRAERRPRAIAIGAGIAIAAAAIATASALANGGAANPAADPSAHQLSCRPARVAPVWTDQDATAVKARGPFYPSLAGQITVDLDSWQTARLAACHDLVPEPELACLDGVAARIELVRQVAVEAPGNAASEDLLAQTLVDPAVCTPATGDPPRLVAKWSPAARAAFTAFVRDEAVRVGDAPAHSVVFEAPPGLAADPCAQTLAAELDAFADAPAVIDPARLAVASQRAALCSDDRVVADALVLQLRYSNATGAAHDDLVRRATAAVARAPQSDLLASLAFIGATDETDVGVIAPALQRAIELFRARRRDVSRLQATNAWLALLVDRHGPGDLEAAAAALPEQLAEVAVLADLTHITRTLDARVRWQRGDWAGAHAAMAVVERDPPADLPPGTARVSGSVIDAAGRPVAGARVAIAHALVADGTLVGLTLQPDDNPEIVTTDRDGTFTALAWPDDTIVAELGARRSRPHHGRDTLRLVLEPTRTVAGRAQISGPRPSSPLAAAHLAGDGQYSVYAPLADDGSFELAGVPDAPVEVYIFDEHDGASSEVTRVDRRGEVRDVQVSVVPATRQLAVTVQSGSTAPVHAAWVIVYEPGGARPRTVTEIDLGHVLAHAIAELDGDAASAAHVARVPRLPAGPLVACAVAAFHDGPMGNTAFPAGASLACRDVPAGTTAIAIDVVPAALAPSPRER